MQYTRTAEGEHLEKDSNELFLECDVDRGRPKRDGYSWSTGRTQRQRSDTV